MEWEAYFDAPSFVLWPTNLVECKTRLSVPLGQWGHVEDCLAWVQPWTAAVPIEEEQPVPV